MGEVKRKGTENRFQGEGSWQERHSGITRELIMDNIEEKLKELRIQWVKYPGKREIIKRQARALELSRVDKNAAERKLI